MIKTKTTHGLNEEEAEILSAFETGNVTRSEGVDEIMVRHKEYAAAAFRKDARINIRLSSRDLRQLQKCAVAEGIPYQTLAASILHKFVDGRFRDKE